MNHYVLNREVCNREEFILQYCANKSVLHLGCADYPYTEEHIKNGTWLHSKLTKVSKKCIGVDLDKNMVELLNNQYEVSNVIQGNVEQLNGLDIEKFDVIVAGEIIEHLNNPGLFLKSARAKLKVGGKLLITTTNAYCFRRFIRIPFGKESIHPDHVYYYSHRTLEALAGRFDYKLTESYSYRIVNKNPVVPYLVERLATIITPNWGEGIVHVYSAQSGQ